MNKKEKAINSLVQRNVITQNDGENIKLYSVLWHERFNMIVEYTNKGYLDKLDFIQVADRSFLFDDINKSISSTCLQIMREICDNKIPVIYSSEFESSKMFYKIGIEIDNVSKRLSEVNAKPNKTKEDIKLSQKLASRKTLLNKKKSLYDSNHDSYESVKSRDMFKLCLRTLDFKIKQKTNGLD